MAFGVTSTGFVKKTLDDIIQEKEATARTLFGSDIDLSETSPLKKFIEVTTLEEVRLWEMSESLYYSAFLGFATGNNLDRVVELLGVTRKAATKATGTVRFSGSDGTVIPQGTRVATDEGEEFVTDASGTISGGSVDIAVTASEFGTDGNVAGNTITNLLDVILGVTSITNPSATSGGTELETDAALRDRAPTALAATGKATVAALEAAILSISGVTFVDAQEDFDEHKVTMIVDGLTLPDANVDQAIEDTRSAGMEVVSQAPTVIDIYVDIEIVYDGTEPTDADDQVETSIINYITGLGIGNDVIYNKIIDEVFDTGSWVSDITILLVGTSYPPTGEANITIAALERADTDKLKVNFLPSKQLSANFTVA